MLNTIESKLLLAGTSLSSEVSKWLDDIDATTADQGKIVTILSRYMSVIHPHFIPWVSSMQNACVTPLGVYAASDNIFLELTEDHQSMLYDFMKQINIFPNPKEYDLLHPMLVRFSEFIQLGVRQKNAIGPATVIYLLENTSQVFIPWIEKKGKELGATNLVYTKKHGEADEEHSKLAFRAVVAEANFHFDGTLRPDLLIEEARLATRELLRAIFS